MGRVPLQDLFLAKDPAGQQPKPPLALCILKDNWWVVRPLRISSQPVQELLFSPTLYNMFPAGNRIGTSRDTARWVPCVRDLDLIMRLSTFLSQ